MTERLFAALLLALACATIPAAAQEAKPLAADPALEARVMSIADQLRCLVCQNETIAASHAARPEEGGEPVGAVVQLLVSDAEAARVDHGRPLRHAARRVLVVLGQIAWWH